MQKPANQLQLGDVVRTLGNREETITCLQWTVGKPAVAFRTDKGTEVHCEETMLWEVRPK